MRLAVEMSQDSKGYASVHAAGCRDLRDPEPIGDVATRADADSAVEDLTGWERPYHYAPCVRLPR